jgi:alanine-synthesizing transaminase
VPTFVLSGLSKIAALPQMKVSWIACLADEVDDMGADRLEVIADTFLSASAPIQCACAAWLSGRGALQRQIRERVDCNLGVLDAMLSRGTLVTRLEVEAGWYAVLRIPLLQAEEQTAMDLLVQRGVVVHSGGLFGFSGQGWLVVSLLGPENEFKQGVEAICAYFHGLAI